MTWFFQGFDSVESSDEIYDTEPLKYVICNMHLKQALSAVVASSPQSTTSSKTKLEPIMPLWDTHAL